MSQAAGPCERSAATAAGDPLPPVHRRAEDQVLPRRWTRLLRGLPWATAVWLLVQPPVQGGALVAAAPIGAWTVRGRFTLQQACERQRSSDSAAILAAIGTAEDPGARQARTLATTSRCIDSESAAPAPTPS